MNWRDTMFGIGKREKKQVELPAAIMADENPVNYDSVLDYLVGLDAREYDKLLKVAVIYRDANKSATKVLGVKDQPTTKLKDDKPTDEEMDNALDGLLETHPDDLKDAILNAPEKPEVKKEQAPSKETKITVNEK
jgi:hypothetical protein